MHGVLDGGGTVVTYASDSGSYLWEKLFDSGFT